MCVLAVIIIQALAVSPSACAATSRKATASLHQLIASELVH